MRKHRQGILKEGDATPGDLHTHTTLSDGSTPIQRLPFLAARAGLGHLAISDHDSVQAVRYACQNPVQQGVCLIPATELTAYDFERGQRVHLLCYWPDDCDALRRHCQVMAARRNRACTQSGRELETLCPQFSLQDALAYARAGGGVLYKATLMRVLCNIGQAEGIYGETYRRLFGKSSAPGPILHDPEYEPVEAVLQTARASRAVVVFAHPSVYHSMPLVRRLAAQGLIDGVEIEHPRNTPEDKEELRDIACRYGLIATGGTDYHGMHAKHPQPVGTCTTEDGEIARIAALARRRKQG